MKLTDYVASFLAGQGVRHVFAVTGGASLHLVHSVAARPDMTFICPQHEQAGAMMADAYSRMTGNLGVAMATSGPGATNMITGICCSYYDSVPTLYITGQVATFRFKGTSGIRQMGFQETEIVTMCKPITKYAVLLEKADRIRYELEKATWIARSGRPGPVLVDIPDDLQRAQVDPDTMESFPVPPRPAPGPALADQVAQALDMIRGAQRPIAVLGWGIRLAGAVEEARRFVSLLGVPAVPTWGALDILPSDHPLLVGSFGTHGTRFGNFAVQNADVVVAIGSRLDTHEIGSPFSHFARGARKIVVDIDAAEVNKFPDYGMRVDLPIQADAKDFLAAILSRAGKSQPPDRSPWLKRIAEWKRTYPAVAEGYRASPHLNPYVWVSALADAARPDATIFVDTGCAVAWMGQAFRFKSGQRYLHAFNNTPMGYSLPGAIGASIAMDGKEVICVTGDGALQMNIQELATVLRHQLPIKIFLLNNHGYSMIQQTQDQWFGSKYYGSTVEGGLAFPEFGKVAAAYGYPVFTISNNAEAPETVRRVLATPGPVFCNVELQPSERVIPQVKYGRPIEDSEPLLERPEFFANMLVEPVEASKT